MFENAPKRRTYAYLGAVIIDDILIAQARQEMDNIQANVNLMAAQAADALNDALTLPQGPDTDSLIASLQSQYSINRQLVSDAVTMQNDFNNRLAYLGLSGFGRVKRVNGLGLLPIIIAITISVVALSALGIYAAQAFKANYESIAAGHNAEIAYYNACADSIKRTGSCSITPPTIASTSMDLTSIALVGGIVVLVFMMVK